MIAMLKQSLIGNFFRAKNSTRSNSAARKKQTNDDAADSGKISQAASR